MVMKIFKKFLIKIMEIFTSVTVYTPDYDVYEQPHSVVSFFNKSNQVLSIKSDSVLNI